MVMNRNHQVKNNSGKAVETAPWVFNVQLHIKVETGTGLSCTVSPASAHTSSIDTHLR